MLVFVLVCITLTFLDEDEKAGSFALLHFGCLVTVNVL